MNLNHGNRSFDIDERVERSTFSDATRRVLETVKGHTLDAEDCRRLISQRLSELDREQHALRACYNSVAPASNLPTEVLSQIFLNRRYTGDKLPVPWPVFAEVCQHWRNVAIGCKELWTMLDFSMSSRMLKYQLKMSEDAPLAIKFNDSTVQSHSMALLQDVLSQTHRLRSIVMTVTEPYNTALRRALPLNWKQASFPLLEEYDVDDTDSIPTPLFLRGSPVLRQLTLARCSAPWAELPLGPNITHLKLANRIITSGKAMLPTMAAFFASLQGMPLLRRLNLSWFLPVDSNSLALPPTPSSPIELPSLQGLTLLDYAPNIGSFFKAARCPNLKKLGVRIALYDGAGAQRVGEALRNAKASTPLETLIPVGAPIHMQIEDDSHKSSSVSLEFHWDSMLPSGVSPKEALGFRFTGVEGGPASYHPFLDLLYDEFQSIAAAEYLRIYLLRSTESHGAEKPGLHVLPRLSKLKELILRDGDQQDVLSLCDIMSVETDALGGAKRRRFPELRTIDMARFTFVAGWSVPPDRSSEIRDAVVRLVDALKEEPQVRTLVLKDCRGFTREAYDFVRRELPELDLVWLDLETGLGDDR